MGQGEFSSSPDQCYGVGHQSSHDIIGFRRGSTSSSDSYCGSSPPTTNRKQSQVKMMVISTDNRQSPTFKPLSGFVSSNEREKLRDLDQNCSRLIPSFKDVIPLKPVEGFVYPERNENVNKCSFYTEHSSPVPSIFQEEPQIQFPLPSVRVFDPDDSLVSKNSFSVPRDHGKEVNFSFRKPQVKLSKPASLFVKPIKKHCATGSGELYVALVESSAISASRRNEGPPAKGNSQRKKQINHVDRIKETTLLYPPKENMFASLTKQGELKRTKSDCPSQCSQDTVKSNVLSRPKFIQGKLDPSLVKVSSPKPKFIFKDEETKLKYQSYPPSTSSTLPPIKREAGEAGWKNTTLCSKNDNLREFRSFSTRETLAHSVNPTGNASCGYTPPCNNKAVYVQRNETTSSIVTPIPSLVNPNIYDKTSTEQYSSTLPNTKHQLSDNRPSVNIFKNQNFNNNHHGNFGNNTGSSKPFGHPSVIEPEFNQSNQHRENDKSLARALLSGVLTTRMSSPFNNRPSQLPFTLQKSRTTAFERPPDGETTYPVRLERHPVVQTKHPSRFERPSCVKTTHPGQFRRPSEVETTHPDQFLVSREPEQISHPTPEPHRINFQERESTCVLPYGNSTICSNSMKSAGEVQRKSLPFKLIRRQGYAPTQSGQRTHQVLQPKGDCVTGAFTNSTPANLTSAGHDPREASSPSSIDPTYFSSRDLEGKSGTMLVTNEPLNGSHLPAPLSHFNANCSSLLNSNLRGNPRVAKYLVDEPTVAAPTQPPAPLFEGCENFGFDSSFGQENPDFDTNFEYLPFGDSRSLDPGYVSERSQEEEEELEEEDDDEEDDDDDDDRSCSSSDDESNLRHSFLEPPQGIRLDVTYLMKIFPFINEGTLFDVTIVKNSRGLGLALTGGVECESAVCPGLVRIRQLYPQTPAWLCGQLQINDFILEANGQQLTGLTSHEALETLRVTGAEVHLVVCRAPKEVLNGTEEESQVDAGDNGVVSTSLTAPQPICGTHFLSPSPSFSTYGEFEIHLHKVSGSLGFTLRKNDNSILGHTIRSLVKEPAISDGRLKPGDKLLSVNGTDMCGLSHEEAVQFLRTCPDSVILRIYRDAMQTPVSPASPTEIEFSKPKALRKEARDMLTDLAFRKHSSPNPSGIPAHDTPSTPRRRRLNKNSSPDTKIDRWESLVRKAEEGSGCCQRGDAVKSREVSPFDNSHSDTLTVASSSSRSGTIISRSSSPNSYRELSRDSSTLSPANSSCSESRPQRPTFLDLNSSHSSRKSQFTPPHEEFPSPLPRQFDSLDSAPQLTSAHSDTPAFSHLQSCYRSVNTGSSFSPFAEQRLTNTSSDHNISTHTNTESPHKKNALLKWKGVVFTPEEEDETNANSPVVESAEQSQNSSIVTLELTRGWNSRLGFSLQNEGDETVIVAIYADSVAAKDGRLKVGDVILEVNEEDVRTWESQSVIDLLRKTRGRIILKVEKRGT